MLPIWLTPYGAIWAAIDAADPAQVQVTQAGGKTVINTSFEGMQVKATLGTDHRPETVEAQTKQGSTWRGTRIITTLTSTASLRRTR